MALTEMCLCFLVRRTSDGNVHEVLLGRKKLGFGTGNIVGLGGHVDLGETPRAAAVREVEEESGVVASESDLDACATITLRFPAKPAWDQRVAVFLAEDWQGQPADSDEVSPEWHLASALPFESMWGDATHWLDWVLNGEHLSGDITFNEDCKTVSSADPVTAMGVPAEECLGQSSVPAG